MIVLGAASSLSPVPGLGVHVSDVTYQSRGGAALAAWGFIARVIGECRVFEFFKHASSVTSKEVQVRFSQAPDRADMAQSRAKTAYDPVGLPVGFDDTTEKGALAYAQELARKTVMATQVDCRTVDAAIYSISRRYKLNSFVRKLWKGEPVVIRLHLIRRLERTYIDAMRTVRDRF